MKEFLSRLVCSVWLLLFSGIVAFAVPTEKTTRSPLTFGYNERTHEGIAYDRTLPIGINYDSAWRLVADEKENGTARHGRLLADFAEFVAAKTAPKLKTGRFLVLTTQWRQHNVIRATGRCQFAVKPARELRARITHL